MNYEKLKEHFGHDIEIAKYENSKNPDQCFTIECIDCNEVICSYDKDTLANYRQV